MRAEWLNNVYVIIRLDNKTVQGCTDTQENAEWIIANDLKDLPYEYLVIRKDMYTVR